MTPEENRSVIHERLQRRELPRVAPAEYRTLPAGRCQVCGEVGLVFRLAIIPAVELCPSCLHIWQEERLADLDR